MNFPNSGPNLSSTTKVLRNAEAVSIKGNPQLQDKGNNESMILFGGGRHGHLLNIFLPNNIIIGNVISY